MAALTRNILNFLNFAISCVAADCSIHEYQLYVVRIALSTLSIHVLLRLLGKKLQVSNQERRFVHITTDRIQHTFETAQLNNALLHLFQQTKYRIS